MAKHESARTRDAEVQPSAQRRVSDPPRVWGLLGHRSGDNQQVAALCADLGWPFELKRLHYGWTSLAPNVVRRARPLGVLVDPRTPVAPPWPDLVVAVGRRSTPLALRVRAASSGRCRLVQLGRPSAPLRWFDLVITTPQYQIPPRSNVLELPLPFGRAPGAAEPLIVSDIAELPRPHTVVLVGGPTAALSFGAGEARDLAEYLARLAASEGGSFLLSTSPRTPPIVAQEMRRRLPAPHRVHEWNTNAGTLNPYATYLATADRVIVTGDSVSMIADACRTGVPVGVYRLPQRRAFTARIATALYGALARRSDAHGAGSRLLFSLVDAGLVVSPRVNSAVHRVLEVRGLIATVPGDLPTESGAARRQDDIAAWERGAVARVRSLVEVR